jgi:hypothetical protein
VPLPNLNRPNAPLALSSSAFTALGPQPLTMTGCTLCFNYTTTEGRVNDIAVDPTTTTPGSIVAYLATVGGGVWKTTNCCTSATSWSVVTDDPLLATVSIDTLTIDPNNHNTIYAGTGDLNFGSFSMGSQGILKSTDAGATWTLLGANVFGPGLPLPAGQFPQYQAVDKVRVDPRNSNNVVAGTKTGLYFSYDGGNNWTGPCTTNNYSTMRQDITGLALSDTGSSTRIIAAVGVRGFSTTVQYNLDQNGANGIYKGTLPASGCPSDFASIATNANGWTGLNAGTGTARGVDATIGNPTPISIVSRKTHGPGHTFDVDLKPPAPGIECRTGGATKDHTVVVIFALPVTVSGNGSVKAQVTSGSGQVGSGGTANGNAVTVSGSAVTVPLTNVANAQKLSITIYGVSDGTNSGNIVVPMSVLLGDTNNNGATNSSDVSQTKANSGQAANNSNFRTDVTVNDVINSSDVSTVKSASGTALPP